MEKEDLLKGLFKKRLFNLIGLALEQPVIFHIILISYSLVAAYWFEHVESFLLKVLILLVPSAVMIQLYLSNLSRLRRATLAVRLRRHDDNLVLSLLVKEILRAMRYVQRSNWQSRLLKRAPTEEKIRSRGAYFTFLFDEVSSHFQVSREVIEEAFGTPVRILTDHLTRLVEINFWKLHNPEVEKTGQTAEMKLAVSRINNEEQSLKEYMNGLKSHLETLLMLTPEVSFVLHKIVKEASTGKAAIAASEILCRYLQETPHDEFIKSLLSLRCGLPLASLLRFDELKRSNRGSIDNLRSYYHLFGNIMEAATSALCQTAKRYIPDHLGNDELIVTFGYSNTVAEVIKTLSTETQKAFQVVIIEPEKLSDWEHIIFKEESRLMETKLKKEIPLLRNRVTRISIDSFLEKQLQEKMTKIFMGAENIRKDAMILHPRGRRALLMSILNARKNSKNNCKIYVFAESYKIIELCEEIYSLPYFVTFYSTEYDYLITEGNFITSDSGVLRDETGQPIAFVRFEQAWRNFVNQRHYHGFGQIAWPAFYNAKEVSS